MAERYLSVDGIRTHYLEAGQGPPLVLLHGGEFGACAELSWERVLADLAVGHHVIAPDWVGYGGTDKVKDFVDGPAFMLRHIGRLLEELHITTADFVATSMGATFLLRDAARPDPVLPARSIVAASGGGFAPDNQWRRALLDYDGTLDSMRLVVEALFEDTRFCLDDDYVQRRHRLSLVPGAWEWAVASRLRSPTAPVRTDVGVVDVTPYQNITVPTLVIAGAQDKLRRSGYAQDLHDAIPGSAVVVFDRCGHCPNIEQPRAFAESVLSFLARVDSDRFGEKPETPHDQGLLT